jgi:hypothetical protein
MPTRQRTDSTTGTPFPQTAGTVEGDVPLDTMCLEAWPELVIAQNVIADSLRRLTGQNDPILLDAAVVRLAGIQEEVRDLAAGRIVFLGTEAWRTVYDQLLRCPDVDCYRSVAWMRNEDYWQDAPGQRSMRTNYELLQDGLSIERILILGDYFWPLAASLPARVVCRWIEEQYQRGISISLVRESEITDETDLLCDIGIYGTRATGTLDLDPQCRTSRFTFDFSPEGIRLAEERWKRLSLYASPYGDSSLKNMGGEATGAQGTENPTALQQDGRPGARK